ncbi:MAG: hydroxymethylbilane synthase [Rhodobacteraceae bacterium]|nr:hydroxymethylbilane synthase [Paracoccaceae bacterium]
MSAVRFVLGTRGSRLALIQTELARDALTRALGQSRESVGIEVFETRGDLNRDCSIEQAGGRGVFTDELDAAVLEGRIDAAVHSVKDLPVTLSSGLRLAATLRREDPREAFVSSKYASLAEVPANGIFGTASVRRAALLRAIKPGADFKLLRGNVDERVAALANGIYDGTILAIAGLKRLGLERHISETLPPDILMPDPGQGAIGIVTRAGHAKLRPILARINHRSTLAEITAERTALAIAGGHTIVGALAHVSEQQLTLDTIAASAEGTIERRISISGHMREAAAIGRRAGLALIAETAEAKSA